MAVTLAYDVTAAFFSVPPSGVQRCGYDTGTSGIKWTAAMWAAYPTAVHIDQDALASDPLSDILDVERGAATPAECAKWVKAAQANFTAVKRPGQRKPAIYCSASNVSAAVNALIAGGVKSGVGLWVANWNLTEANAIAEVLAASGPFPVIGIQFTDTGGGGDYDIDVFSTAWLQEVSVAQLVFPLKPGDSDGPGSTSGLVHTLQLNLNKWRETMGSKFAVLTVDGEYGPATTAAVTTAQGYFKNNGMPGTCDQPLFNDLNGALPKPPDPPGPTPAPAPTGLEVKSNLSNGSDVTLAWNAVSGVTQYQLQIEHYKNGFGWVLDINAPVTGLSAVQSLPPRLKHRFRVAAVSAAGHVWPDWEEFATQ